MAELALILPAVAGTGGTAAAATAGTAATTASSLAQWGTLISTGATAAGGLLQAYAGKTAADTQAQWAERRANEELAAGQQRGRRELKAARKLQSDLIASAAASGGGTGGTVLDIFGDIEEEGRVNAGNQVAGAQQRASGIKYQADLDKYKADSNMFLSGVGALGTLAGGLGKYGEIGLRGMAKRYASPNSWQTTTYRYG